MSIRFFEVNKKGEVKEVYTERPNYVMIDKPYYTYEEWLKVLDDYGYLRDENLKKIPGPENKYTEVTYTVVTFTQE